MERQWQESICGIIENETLSVVVFRRETEGYGKIGIIEKFAFFGIREKSKGYGKIA